MMSMYLQALSQPKTRCIIQEPHTKDLCNIVVSCTYHCIRATQKNRVFYTNHWPLGKALALC